MRSIKISVYFENLIKLYDVCDVWRESNIQISMKKKLGTRTLGVTEEFIFGKKTLYTSLKKIIPVISPFFIHSKFTIEQFNVLFNSDLLKLTSQISSVSYIVEVFTFNLFILVCVFAQVLLFQHMR